MVENQTELGNQISLHGTEWNGRQGSGVQRDVQEALDTDLDAYLDRALSAQPAPELKPALAAEKPAERLQSVLALAAEEEQWIRKSPPTVQPLESAQDPESAPCEIPEHLKVKPAPEVSPAPAPVLAQAEAPWTPLPAPLPGLAVVPQPGWNLPVAPAPVAPRRTPWLVTGALVGVSAASVLVAAMLWMTRDTLPEKPQAPGAATGPATATVTTVAPPAAPPASVLEPVLFVKDSPLQRKPDPHLADWIAAAEGFKVALPAGTIARAAAPVVAKAEPLKPREPVQAVQARRVHPVAAPPARRDIEDPTVADTEEEIPFMQEPVAARAPEPVAKPAPPAAPKPSEYDELDREFARQLGFTDDAVRSEPGRHGVKSVWIPPAPGEDLPQTLKPEEIQQAVAANQHAITSCIQRHKGTIPGLNGGKFVMRWFIHPRGSTYQVAMETQALRGTAMAACIEEEVRAWKFPRHQTQMGPIRFPFIF